MPEIHNSETTPALPPRLRGLIAAGLATAALGAGSAAEQPASAAPQTKGTAAHEFYPAGDAQPGGNFGETSKTLQNPNFVRIMNSRVRRAAIRFAKIPERGPAKPIRNFEASIGNNRLFNWNYQVTPGPFGDKGYSVSVIAPTLPKGGIDYSKVFSTEIRAGRTSIGLRKDYNSSNWIVDYEIGRRHGEPERHVAAAKLEVAEANKLYGNEYISKLTQRHFRAAVGVAEEIERNLQSGDPPARTYPNPLD